MANVMDIDSALLRFAQLTDEQKESVVEKAVSKLRGKKEEAEKEFDNLHSDEAAKLMMDSDSPAKPEEEAETEAVDEAEETGQGKPTEDDFEDPTGMTELVDSLASEIEMIKGDGKIDPSEAIGLFDNMMQMVTLLLQAKPKVEKEKKASIDGMIERIATEFETKALMDSYLKEHPDADKSRHTFKEPASTQKTEAPVAEKPSAQGEPVAEKPSAQEEPVAEKPSAQEEPSLDAEKDTTTNESDAPDEKRQTLRNKIKDFSTKIKDSIKGAPEAVKKLVEDEEYRNDKMKSVANGIKNSPKAIGKTLLEAAKAEVKEIKHAGHAIGKLAKGEKLDKEDKHSLYAVGVYAAGTALAAASGGTLGGALALGHSFKLHVAIKALHKMADEGFLGFEAYETVHHALEAISHVASDRTAQSDDEEQRILINWILASVVSTLDEGISQDEMNKILEGVDYSDAEEALNIDFKTKKEDKKKPAKKKPAKKKPAKKKPAKKKPAKKKPAKKKASQDDIEDGMIERMSSDSMIERLALEHLGSRGNQTRRKDKDTMSDTGGVSKGRDREPHHKPPRDDVKNRFKPKKQIENDSDTNEDPDSRPD